MSRGERFAEPDAALIALVDEEVRKAGAQSVLRSHAVAAHVGLNASDLECLDLLYLKGRATAGELAKAAGLTSGATTTLIDRLERAGYVRRIPDAKDRRRVNVEIDGQAIAPIAALYRPMQENMHALWSAFSRGELETVIRFLAASNALAVASMEDIRALPPMASGKRRGRSRR